MYPPNLTAVEESLLSNGLSFAKAPKKVLTLEIVSSVKVVIHNKKWKSFNGPLGLKWTEPKRYNSTLPILEWSHKISEIGQFYL